MNKGLTKAMMLSNGNKSKGSNAKDNNQSYGRDYNSTGRDYDSRDYNRMSRNDDSRMGRNNSGYDDGREGYARYDRMGREGRYDRGREDYPRDYECMGGYGSRYGRYDYDDRDMSQYGNMGRRYGRESDGYNDYGKESRDRMGRRREAGARYEDDDDEDGGAYRFRMDGKLDMGKVGHVDKLTALKAEEITRKMVNEDGSKGAHWNMEQTKQVMEQRGIQTDPVEFYVAMNMMYSDYYPVAKKLNVNSVDFYAELARAFLEDKDAGKDKLAKYFSYVVK